MAGFNFSRLKAIAREAVLTSISTDGNLALDSQEALGGLSPIKRSLKTKIKAIAAEDDYLMDLLTEGASIRAADVFSSDLYSAALANITENPNPEAEIDIPWELKPGDNLTAEVKFLRLCDKLNLKLSVNFDDYTISITGSADLAAQAQSKLDNSREFRASVLVALAETDAILKDLLTERAAIRATDGLPDDLYSAALANMTDTPIRCESKQAKQAPQESKTKFHIFEVEDEHGARFKYSIACLDEVLQDALDGLGLQVIEKNETRQIMQIIQD